MPPNEALKSAVTLALAGEWDASHQIVQKYDSPLACWIHAVLHKIEGDDWNSRYWYARTQGHAFEHFPSPEDELHEIFQHLTKGE